jgi:hypothetical protein
MWSPDKPDRFACAVSMISAQSARFTCQCRVILILNGATFWPGLATRRDLTRGDRSRAFRKSAELPKIARLEYSPEAFEQTMRREIEFQLSKNGLRNRSRK